MPIEQSGLILINRTKKRNKFIAIFEHVKKTTLFILFTIISASSFAQSTGESEQDHRNYLIKHKDSLNQIEGVWEIDIAQEFYHYDTLFNVIRNQSPSRVAIKRNAEKFQSHTIYGNPLVVEFTQTDVKGVYLFRNFYSEIEQFSKSQAVICNAGAMEYTIDVPENYLKQNPENEWTPGLRVVHIFSWTKVY